jgi:hypothetical protein
VESLTKEKRKKRRELNKMARAAGNPPPYPELEWNIDDEKMVSAAIKKFTKNFKSLPRGYDREAMLQEGRLKWAAVKDKHAENKGKKSTYCFKVIRNQITDLIRAGNTDKRKIEQYTLEYIKGITEGEFLNKPPGDHQARLSKQYDGERGGNYSPTARGVKDSERWRGEQEPDPVDLIPRRNITDITDLTPHNVSRINRSGDDDDIILK